MPHDNDHLPTPVDDSARPEHDSDVKLPGRHYPKLPYTLIDRYDDLPYPHPGSSQPKPQPHPRSDPYHYDYNYDDYWEGEEGEEEAKKHLKSPQSDTSGASSSSSSSSSSSTSTPEPRDPSPRFDRDQPRSVKVQAGKTAVLVCRVLNLGDKSVSWIRHEDLHILTVDKYKYSTDRRLSVVHDEVEHEWLLKIQSVRQEDAGMYECQVSTKPLLSFIVSLQVVDAPPSTTPYPSLRDAEKAAAPTQRPEKQVPSATILNGPEIHVHRGSLINLTCVVEHTPERPLYVVWYHYNKVIDYEDLGGVVVVTHTGQKTVSQLLVKRAEPSDSGKYTCQPSNGEAAFVMLHVLYGEHPGALQTNGGRRGGVSRTEGVVAPLLTLLLLLLHAPC
ncbi:zwei Ig domain protein zig-8-like [Scylla paramamosain]|uniref:zwei Ig domain protein zig-8-like n=1 Tax=Scylla paramamosain TaxID=85552 RepID=UPI003083C80C